jgi:hypothetical protein
MISAAFENSSSENPEHWQNAAGTCRRLLMTAADRLRPMGPDVNGRKMGANNYVNRLVDWIVQGGTSETASAMIAADLEYLGKRLDAADSAGQKGAHVGEKQVSRFEASRFVTGTYLVLGDILRVQAAAPEKAQEPNRLPGGRSTQPSSNLWHSCSRCMSPSAPRLPTVVR